ncbi:MAG TPA: GNAT family N-acetyltransferase [Mycobacteriales bacterium]|nr:GNAT family N-acetyltransferase [Mycobacteriales bacterium]
MTVLPRAAGGAVAGVIGFTAHHVVAADVDPDWVRSVLPPGSLSAPMSARFLAALADRVGAEPGAYDTVLVAPRQEIPPQGIAPQAVALQAVVPQKVVPQKVVRQGIQPQGIQLPGIPLAGLTPVTGADSARLRRAERYRTDVRAWTVPGAILVLGRGLAGRWEVSLEVDPAYRGRGLGRALVATAPALVPPATVLWAQVSPANVASLRMFLAAGYRPVAAEVLLA